MFSGNPDGRVQYKICKFFDWLRDWDVRLVLLKFRRDTAGQDFIRCAFVTNHCMQRSVLAIVCDISESRHTYFSLIKSDGFVKGSKRNIFTTVDKRIKIFRKDLAGY